MNCEETETEDNREEELLNRIQSRMEDLRKMVEKMKDNLQGK